VPGEAHQRLIEFQTPDERWLTQDITATEAFLAAYIEKHGELPPSIAALLRDW
jgi:hypothetical protein